MRFIWHKTNKKVTLFVSFVLQYPMLPNFTYLNDVVELDKKPKSKSDIGELETVLRNKVMSNMISDDKNIRLTILSITEI